MKLDLDKEKCPVCGADWFAGIREEDGARCSRMIAIYDQRRDMTIQYRCPDCGAIWDRFTLEQVK